MISEVTRLAQNLKPVVSKIELSLFYSERSRTIGVPCSVLILV
jgi:hypothetical protein